MSCPTCDNLLAYAAGSLEPAVSSRVEAHMKTGCRSCNETLDEVTMLRDFADPTLLPDVPEWISSRATTGRDAPSALSYLVAGLVHDTYRDPLPLGARASPADARHMLFSADGFDVNVRLTPAGAGLVRLVGQVLAPEDADPLPEGETEVVLAGARVGFVARPVDALGAFAFDPLPEGEYELTVAAPRCRVVVSGVPVLRAPRDA